MAGASRSETVTAVASSSGSAPASSSARAKLVTPSPAAAAARCSAKVSAPHTMAATPEHHSDQLEDRGTTSTILVGRAGKLAGVPGNWDRRRVLAVAVGGVAGAALRWPWWL